ncbi:MAG: hypothetical protein BGO78_06930 [Chloroflexi bacterium 44-23]|nr:MAG: hypothetical protein BGO78_06930 [Chloroflexi bacterium 44-23]
MTLVFTVNMIYFVTEAGFDPLQMVLIGTTLELSIFLFEIPTGIVADTISRKWSVIIGTFLIGCGFILQSLVIAFPLILLAQVLWGIGYTFTSGALQAWISDEVGENRAAGLFIKATQWEQAGGLLAIGLSVLTATIFQIWIPMLLGGLGFLILGAIMILIMGEFNFHPAQVPPTRFWLAIPAMAATVKNGFAVIKLRPVLIRILLVGFFFGLYSEGLDRLWVPHLIERFHLPDQGQASMIGWIGILQAVSLVISFFAAGLIHRYIEKNTGNRGISGLLTFLAVLLVGSLALFAFARRIEISFIVLILISVIREMIAPLYTAWVNYRLQSESRATILSLSSQVDAFGQISGGPLVGIMASNTGIQNGLFLSAILLSPVVGLLFTTPYREPVVLG